MISALASQKELVVIQGALDALPLEKWKNGQGLTRELARSPGSDLLWRVSSAFVKSSGPFSVYEGYDRVICLLDGGPIVISHSDGKKKTLNSLVAYKFNGDLKTEAIITSAVVDLNVFLKRGRTKGMIYTAVISQGEEYQFPISANEHFVLCLRGACEAFERASGRKYNIVQNGFLHITRNGNTEFPNLKVVSCSEPALIIWIPIHLL